MTVTTDETYPILEEVTLRDIPKRLLRRSRRDVSELPRQRAGTVLIFQVNNQYLTAPGQRLAGDEQVVVAASSVSLVEIRRRQMTVEVRLESANPANAFVLKVTFGCQVADAATVVATHADIRAELQSYVRQDRQLRTLAGEFTLADMVQAREQLTAQVEARWSLRPIDVDGVDIELGDVEVLTPTDLVAFEQARQRDDRTRVLERAHRDFDRSEAELIEKILLRGPVAIEALAIRLGEVSHANATTRSYGEADKATDRLIELLSTLSGGGQLDTVPIEVESLIDQLVGRLTGTTSSVTYREAELGQADPARPLEGRRKPQAGDNPDFRAGTSPQEVEDDV